MLGAICLGGWFVWDSFPALREFAEEKIHSRDFSTLEIRFSPEEIMEKYRKELLKGAGYSYLEPQLIFYPYVKMDTKFSTDNSSTQEGILLWGLTDGEMVINSTTWERTHGYEDCLIAKASKDDFKILRAVLESGGAIDRERLYQKFKSEGDMVDKWIRRCRSKNLIISSGSRFRLHLQNPRMENVPITMMKEPLVAQPTKHSIKSKKRYSIHQIQKLTQIAFGPSFAIRKTEQVFLPVYSIGVQNPDGSILVTYWNALNGRPFEQVSNF
ncbi:MAG: hypothetical protein S4CHLAM45_12670 [Chlamydiales bacterium]|nr:hypothetical protein [Chlamydiales bacterium]MCH9619756.1 hypothetical protein [Chlamydiales bacterium]MCH9623362.1 hypothetical protein [Chlamydiales bacterium]